MITYQCKECKQVQFSASEAKKDEPCIYCGAEVELINDGSKESGLGYEKAKTGS